MILATRVVCQPAGSRYHLTALSRSAQGKESPRKRSSKEYLPRHLSLPWHFVCLLGRSRIVLPVSGKSPCSVGHGPGRSRFMRHVSKICGATVSLGLATALMGFVSGCDASGGQKTEYKPIESNIIKKLGTSGPAQSEAARESHIQGKPTKKG